MFGLVHAHVQCEGGGIKVCSSVGLCVCLCSLVGVFRYVRADRQMELWHHHSGKQQRVFDDGVETLPLLCSSSTQPLHTTNQPNQQRLPCTHARTPELCGVGILSSSHFILFVFLTTGMTLPSDCWEFGSRPELLGYNEALG